MFSTRCSECKNAMYIASKYKCSFDCKYFDELDVSEDIEICKFYEQGNPHQEWIENNSF